MKHFKIPPLILYLTFSACICGTSFDSNAQAQESMSAVALPRGLEHASEFVDFLRKGNLSVEEVGQSHFTGMLGTQRMAAFIKTNKGVVEVVFFPRQKDAEKIIITYEKGQGSSKHHIYTLNGEAVTGKKETLNAAYPIYITLHDNWLIVTSDCEMESILKRALRQTNSPK